ncbi:hypothetical protein GCM10010411_71330 [Actinomadura fulvescens]|uniref:Uncharacterized protein n=1 Tax=Actinomadura fulvescens TaxID=46160 RepID=A0ABN3QFH7_9ACTN
MIFGAAGTPAPGLSTTPRLASCGPPTGSAGAVRAPAARSTDAGLTDADLAAAGPAVARLAVAGAAANTGVAMSGAAASGTVNAVAARRVLLMIPRRLGDTSGGSIPVRDVSE